MRKLGSITHEGEELDVILTEYRNGGPALVLHSTDGTPYATFSVNIPDEPLGPMEVAVKTWNENAAFRAPMLNTGLFTDTERRIPCGFTEAEVWKLHI